MNYLVDTHALLWMMFEPGRLPLPMGIVGTT